jgi:hypothetical protein
VIANGLACSRRFHAKPTARHFTHFGAYLIALRFSVENPWREGIVVALSCLGAGLYGIYLVFVFRASPGLAAWSGQNEFTSPDLADFLIGFAPLIVLAAAGLYLYYARRRTLSLARYHSFLIAWLMAAPIMAYLPLVINRRLISGWQIPCAPSARMRCCA